MKDILSNAKAQLLKVLGEARELLVLPGNDFSWSRWNTELEALADIDRFVCKVESGQTFELIKLEMLFGPTGPIQEVSLSSGWGKEFLSVAAEFDSALAEYRKRLLC